MMRDNFSKLKVASEDYVLNDNYELTERVLAYIKERITQNKKEIQELIELRKENITYDEILKVIDDEIQDDIQYKAYTKLMINKDKFLSASIAMPIGVVAVEAFDTKEVIKYFIKAIKTRNAIAISDVEYDENDVKTLILIIIKEALSKFNIKEDLIMILPYEECFYEYFDKVIYTYDEKGNTLETPRTEQKEGTDDTYVYIEDESLREEAIKNENSNVLTGELYSTIDELNKIKPKGSVIYTKDTNKAYKFINLVKSKNVFVNTNLQNIKDTTRKDSLLFEYRNIIIPIPQEMEKEIKQEVEDNKEEKSLVVVKEKGIFEKIKEILKRLFSK